MPEIKCHHGCSMSIGTTEWLATLTLDQLVFARDHADGKIKAARQEAMRTVWIVSNGVVNVCWFRDSEAALAADYLMGIFKEKFLIEAEKFVAKPYGTARMPERIPHIYVELVTQFEYDTEWFPAKP